MSIDSKKVAKFAREWNKAGATKVYFTNLEKLYGLEFSSESYSLQFAILDGDLIEWAQALSLRSKLSIGGIWFDFETNQFGFDAIDPVIANCIIDEIRSKINGDAYHG